MQLILLVLLTAGVKPVKEVEPLKVHATCPAVVTAGIWYAVPPKIELVLTRLGFAMFASYRLKTIVLIICLADGTAR
jgi:hypothetical protein